jgi:hypothetical protein
MLSNSPTKKRIATTCLDEVTAAKQNVNIVQASSQLGIQMLGRILVKRICEGIWPTT